MTTNVVASRHGEAVNTRRGRLKVAALGTATALMLAACGAGGDDVYIDGFWAAGDPVYSPVKDTLFDEDGEPLCEIPLVAAGLETRGKAYSEFGGVVVHFLWEAFNPELDANDPAIDEISNPRQQQTERLRREFAVDPLPRMYQLTHPEFDEKYGIEGPEDLAPLRDEIAEHLSMIDLSSAPMFNYLKPGREWLELEDGTSYNIRIEANVSRYIEENNIQASFEGLVYEYRVASSGIDNEYLMITERETGETRLLNSDGDVIFIDEEAQRFQIFTVRADFSFPDDVYANVTVVNDQCPPIGRAATARFWIRDIELLEVFEREEITL